MLRSRRSLLVSLAVVAAAGVVAVGASWAGNSTKAGRTHAQALSSALVLSVGKSPANPFGYSNLLAYQAAAKVLGGSTKTVELLPTGQFESTFTNFAREGIKIIYAGTWQDPSKVRAAAQALLGQGFDVIRHETNAAGAGLFDAVKGTHAWAVGSYLDQRPLAPNNTLISSGANFTAAYTLVAKKL